MDQLFERKYEKHIAALVADASLTKVSKLPSLAKLLKGPDGLIWDRGTANEFGRLLPNGIGRTRPTKDRIEGTGTIYPIRRANIPKGVESRQIVAIGMGVYDDLHHQPD